MQQLKVNVKVLMNASGFDILRHNANPHYIVGYNFHCDGNQSGTLCLS